MEEKKTKESESGKRKLSYEDLYKAATQLSKDNVQLKRRLDEMQQQMARFDMAGYVLGVLLKVMDHPERYDGDFVVSVTERVQGMVTSLVASVSPGTEDGGDEA